MKKIYTLAIVLMLSTTMGHAGINWPWNKKPQSTPVTVVVEAKKEPITINSARQLVKELNAELQTAKHQNAALKDNLHRANKKVSSAETEMQIVKVAAEKLKAWGIVQQAEKLQWMQKYEKAVKRYHRLKMMAAMIAAAAGIFIGLQFMNLVPPPYNFAVPVGGALLFSTLVWMFL